MANFDNIIDDVLGDLLTEDVEGTEDVVETDEVLDDDTDAEPAEDSVEDEELEGGDDEEAEGDGDDDSDVEVIELDPDMTVRIDGKEVQVKEALELKADYTRKTQALAEERKAFEAEKVETAERLNYLSQLEQAWLDEPANLLASFVASPTGVDPEDLLAETVVTLSANGVADGSLALVKLAIALAANDALDEDLAEQFGFTDEVIARVKRQSQSEQRVARVERRLAAEDQKRSSQEQQEKAQAAYEAEVQKHLAELNSQWEKVSANPEVAAMSDDERRQLRVALVEYARDNDGVPLTVAYDALEAKRLRGETAKRAAAAATRQKKAKASRVVSKPSTAGASPATRSVGDWDSAIAEAVAELETRRAKS